MYYVGMYSDVASIICQRYATYILRFVKNETRRKFQADRLDGLLLHEKFQPITCLSYSVERKRVLFVASSSTK
jgi:hypothetical protein